MTEQEIPPVEARDANQMVLGGEIVTREDVIARLKRAGEYLGNLVAGYRDGNNRRAAKGAADAAWAMMDARAFMERDRALLAKEPAP